MARKLPPKDVVIIGLGWTGSILGYELAKAGLMSLRPRRIFLPLTHKMNCVTRCASIYFCDRTRKR
jgi:ketopantoate reductase